MLYRMRLSLTRLSLSHASFSHAPLSLSLSLSLALALSLSLSLSLLLFLPRYAQQPELYSGFAPPSFMARIFPEKLTKANEKKATNVRLCSVGGQEDMCYTVGRVCVCVCVCVCVVMADSLTRKSTTRDTGH